MTIKVESFFTERFINMCINKRILLWNVKRKNDVMLTANIGKEEYKKLREVSRNTKSKVRILQKKGLPFIMHRYRKRKLFAILLILMTIGLVVCSGFIWNIEVEGDFSFSKEELLLNLEEYGLRIGSRKSNIDRTDIINNIRLKRTDIAWIGINIKGTNAIVEVQEAKLPPEIIRTDEYCNIVADKSGVITRMSVQNGTGEKQEGDIVKPRRCTGKRNC